MRSQNCFCSFCYVDSIFASFYLTGQLKLIRQKFQLAGKVLMVSNPHVFNLTRQLESKPLEFGISYFSCNRSPICCGLPNNFWCTFAHEPLTKQQGHAAHTQPACTTPHTTVTTSTHNPPRRWRRQFHLCQCPGQSLARPRQSLLHPRLLFPSLLPPPPCLHCQF